MAVVEVGTYNTRAGYIGDVTCTRCVRSLRSTAAPEEVDLFSILYSASRSIDDTAMLPLLHEVETGGSNGLGTTAAPSEALLQLWSLRQLEGHADAHMDALRRMKKDVLECSEQDPLCLVLPEVWHERIDVMEALFQVILETPGLTTALYCMRPSVGWTFSSGAASSIVLDVGHSHTTVTAVLDGYALRHSVDTLPVGGDAMTAQYSELLAKYRPAVEAAAPALSQGFARDVYWSDWVADVKHCFARVLPYHVAGGSGRASTDNGTAAAAASTATSAVGPDLQAPDGTRVLLDERKAAAPFELFFRDTADKKGSVAAMMATCKRRMDPEWQLHTVPHLLAGAGSRVPGFRDRVLEELKAQDSSYFRYERDGAMSVVQSSDGAWAGASMAASSSSFAPLWVTRGEWAEEGASVLHRKLFY
jgi:actin-related protein